MLIVNLFLQPVLYFFGGKDNIELSDVNQVHWGENVEEIPSYTPICKFTSDAPHCQDKGILAAQ